jgi:CheY-like chemotaxis protein
MKKYKVLLVDDSPVVRAVISKQLQLLGIDPDLREDGQLAVEAAQATIYDLILMDVMMPNLDGKEATKQIRKIEQETNRKRTPIVGVTGYTDRASCIEAGMDDFLFKPVSIEQLRGTVKIWIPESDVPTPASLAELFANNDAPLTQSELTDQRISNLKVRLGFNDNQSDKEEA